MDNIGQGTGQYPQGGPPPTAAGVGGQMYGQPAQAGSDAGQTTYGQPPYGQGGYAPAYGAAPPWEAPPPAPKGRGWIVALAVVGFVIVGVIVMCGWMGSLFSSGQSLPSGDAIALIHIEGVIAGTSGGGLTGSAVTPENVLSQLRQAKSDRSVKAVLLRVDSPGGTVAASEEIATEVANVGKPVVVSIGDIGASGAYMVSSQADWIVASPGSNVGSIGVILEVANLEGLLDKLGVKFAVISAGEFKTIGSPYRSLTATETKMLQQQVDLVYGQFIDIVAAGRKMPKSDVKKLATGMAWVGTQAKTYGLVDQIGTYNDAVAKAAELGKITGTPRIVEYRRTTYVDLLSSLLGATTKLDAIGNALGVGASDRLAPTEPLPR